MAINVSGGILSLASEIAERYEAPIPLLEIAEEELIRVICDDYGAMTFDGLTWFEAETDEFFIHLNTNKLKGNYPKSVKGRFTLAHELGHYFIPYHRLGLMNGELKPHGSVNFLTNQGAWQLERDADAFASNLLMPTIYVKQLIKGRCFDFGLIEEIAETFQVSKSAAALRFADIGNTPIMVVYAIDGKIQWVSRSEDFPFWRLRNGNGKGDRVPENTVMGTYFYEHDNSDCRQEETVFAGDCFDTKREEDNDMEFFEWCIEHQNKAFSVFWEK